MAAKRDTRRIKGWTELCADSSWEDYGGRWCKKGPDGAWYVLKFENMYDAMGEKDAKESGAAQFSCEVVYCKLDEVDPDEVVRALESCGADDYIERVDIDASWRYLGKRPKPGLDELILLECLTGYGVGGILETFTSETAPWGIRNEARKYAEKLMRDEDEREERLDRQVNVIGNSARDFARGQIGFHR